MNRIARHHRERMTDVNSIINVDSEGERGALSESENVEHNPASVFSGARDVRADSIVEIGRRRTRVSPGVGLGIELGDIGVGHVDTTDAGSEVSQ